MVNRPKGTQDFLDLSLYNFILESAKKFLTLHHFHEIATPIIESTELFKRSLGTYTDVVGKEMFTIAAHQESEKEPLCLRPEMTASTVRAFIENNVETTPWRVFSQGPVFRYERPQKGRFRQFHQLNVELIGGQSVAYDAQFICMLDRWFHDVLNINNYALQVNFLGCPDDRAAYRVTLQNFLAHHDATICQTCRARATTNTLRVFDCKNEQCQTLYATAPMLTDALCKVCQDSWHALQDYLNILSVSFVHKPTLVRGLDYYNNTAFEFVSNNLGAQNTFCGGGRYDFLIQQLSEKHDQPALGAAIGIERLMIILEPYLVQLPLAKEPAVQALIALSPEQQPLVLLLADTLTAAGICVEVLFDGSLKSNLRKANKMGAAQVILVGSDEQQTRTATVKNMVTGAEERVNQVELVNYFKRAL